MYKLLKWALPALFFSNSSQLNPVGVFRPASPARRPTRSARPTTRAERKIKSHPPTRRKKFFRSVGYLRRSQENQQRAPNQNGDGAPATEGATKKKEGTTEGAGNERKEFKTKPEMREPEVKSAFDNDTKKIISKRDDLLGFMRWNSQKILKILRAAFEVRNQKSHNAPAGAGLDAVVRHWAGAAILLVAAPPSIILSVLCQVPSGCIFSRLASLPVRKSPPAGMRTWQSFMSSSSISQVRWGQCQDMSMSCSGIYDSMPFAPPQYSRFAQKCSLRIVYALSAHYNQRTSPLWLVLNVGGMWSGLNACPQSWLI